MKEKRQLYKELKKNWLGILGVVTIGYSIVGPILTGTEVAIGNRDFWNSMAVYVMGALELSLYASQLPYKS